LLLWAALAAP
jgi:hypothetical protein